MSYKIMAVLTAVALLSACGNNSSDRAISGAGLGAAAGAVGGAVVGGSVAGGALVGGLVGAAAGGLTNEHNLNLGRPIWK